MRLFLFLYSTTVVCFAMWVFLLDMRCAQKECRKRYLNFGEYVIGGLLWPVVLMYHYSPLFRRKLWGLREWMQEKLKRIEQK